MAVVESYQPHIVTQHMDSVWLEGCCLYSSSANHEQTATEEDKGKQRG